MPTTLNMLGAMASLIGMHLWRAPSCCLQGIVDQRLQETPENWRLVYKALLLLEYMVKHGPMVSLPGTGQGAPPCWDAVRGHHSLLGVAVM
jgi:hypothetical protein